MADMKIKRAFSARSVMAHLKDWCLYRIVRRMTAVFLTTEQEIFSQGS
jgi:hypothetical protein